MVSLAAALIKKGHHVTVASAGGVGVQMLTERGILHRTLPFAGKSPHALLAAHSALCRLLREENANVVHAHARLPAALAAPLCKARGIPLVVTAHWVFRTDGWRGRLSAWGEHTLAVSEDICRYLQKHYRIPRTSITKTQNGIDISRFSPEAVKSDSENNTGGVQLLHTSRLDTGRARCAELLIGLAPRLANAGVASLCLLGGGDREGELRTMAEEQNRRIGGAFIRMTGAVTDVIPHFRGADVFIGVSRAALEAMSCGLPVVLAGDEGFLPLISEKSVSAAEESNFCGRGLTALTAEGLFTAITALASDAEKRETIGAWGRAYIAEKHTADAMAKDALSAYRAAKRAKTRPRIFLCGYYGYGNLGDEAVLSRLGKLLGGDFSLTVLSGDAKKTETLHRLKAVSRHAPLSILGEMRRADLFLLGGGNLLQNETSDRSLSYYMQLLRLARRAGCRTVLLGGIGQLDMHGERRVKEILPLLDAALLRTPRDLRRFHTLAGKGGRFFPDGGLFVYGEKPPLRGARGDEKTVILALRRGDAEAATAFWDICRALIVAGERCRFLGLPMQEECDRAAFSPFSALPCFSLLSPRDHTEAAAAVSDADLVLSTRLHTLIFASAAGVPAITVTRGGKLADFAAFAAAAERRARGRADFPPYPMLTLSEEKKAIPAEVLSAMLREPPSEQARTTYLRELQRGGGKEILIAALKGI